MDLAIGDKVQLCERHSAEGVIIRVESGWLVDTYDYEPPKYLRWASALLSPAMHLYPGTFFRSVLQCRDCPDFDQLVIRSPGSHIR